MLNLHQFRRHSGGVRKNLVEKGVIEIIFLDNRRNRFPHLYFIPVRMPNVGSREAKRIYRNEDFQTVYDADVRHYAECEPYIVQQGGHCSRQGAR